MIGLAQAKIDELKLGERIALHRGEVGDLPSEAVYDGATLVLVEHLLPDDGTKIDLLRGVAQRVKRGGIVVMASLYGDFSTPETQLALEAWQAYLKFVGFPEDLRQTFRRRATVEDSLSTPARIHDLLTQAGFEDIQQIFSVHLLGGWMAQKA